MTDATDRWESISVEHRERLLRNGLKEIAAGASYEKPVPVWFAWVLLSTATFGLGYLFAAMIGAGCPHG